MGEEDGGEEGVGKPPQGTDERKLHNWLASLDAGGGRLLRYFDVLCAEFEGDLRQIAAVRLARPVSPGMLGFIDPSFWQVCGVELTGHRILLAKAIRALP